MHHIQYSIRSLFVFFVTDFLRLHLPQEFDFEHFDWTYKNKMNSCPYTASLIDAGNFCCAMKFRKKHVWILKIVFGEILALSSRTLDLSKYLSSIANWCSKIVISQIYYTCYSVMSALGMVLVKARHLKHQSRQSDLNLGHVLLGRTTNEFFFFCNAMKI